MVWHCSFPTETKGQLTRLVGHPQIIICGLPTRRVSWPLVSVETAVPNHSTILTMDDTNSLIEQRKAKLAALRAKGIDPFKNKFTPTESCADAREKLRRRPRSGRRRTHHRAPRNGQIHVH